LGSMPVPVPSNGLAHGHQHGGQSYATLHCYASSCSNGLARDAELSTLCRFFHSHG